MTWPVPVRLQIQKLPRQAGSWQLGIAPVRPLLPGNVEGHICVCIQADGRVRAQEILPAPPDGPRWAKLLLQAMLKPLPTLKPARPSGLRLRDGQLAAGLQPFADSVGIPLEIVPEMPQFDAMAAGLSQHMAGGGRVVLSEREPALFQAAASYARAQPWQHFDSEPFFELETAIPDWPYAVAVVMGGMGETFGVAVFQDPEELHAAFARGGHGPPHAVGRLRQVSVTLSPARDVPAVERKRAAQRKFELVPGFFPVFSRHGGGRPPSDLTSVHQADVAMAALRGIVAWVDRCESDVARNREARHDELIHLDETTTIQLVAGDVAMAGFSDQDDQAEDPVEALTGEALAVSFMRIDMVAFPAEVRAQWGGRGDANDVPVLALATTAHGLADMEDELALLDAIVESTGVHGDDFLLLTMCDLRLSAIMAQLPESARPPEAWRQAVTAFDGRVFLLWVEGPGTAPPTAEDLDRTVGGRVVEFHGLR